MGILTGHVGNEELSMQYEGGEPCGICGHVMLPAGGKTHESCMPTTIINGFLYLGSYDTASRQELLKAMGISHILNVRPYIVWQQLPALGCLCSLLLMPLQTVPTCPALYKNTFTYHTVADVPPRFEECFDFLGKSKRQQSRQVCSMLTQQAEGHEIHAVEQ